MLRNVAISTLVGVGVLVSASAIAEAHKAGWAYPDGTYPDARDRVEFRFHTSVPKGRWRARISNGAQEWNRYDRRLVFAPPASGEPSATTEPKFACPALSDTPRPSIVFRSAQAAFAANFTCMKKSDGRPFYFRMFFDPTFKWWTDPNNNRKIPFDRYDVQSAATHEFGHATGWGPHYDDNPDDPEGPKVFKSYCRIYRDQTNPNDRVNGTRRQDNIFTGQQTMCSRMASGGVHLRTLGSHDRGTFRNAYGPR
jgi:hypothetical protein